MPITLDDCQLVLQTNSGEIRGEFKIGEYDIAALGGRPSLRLEPAAKLNPEAGLAIAQADLIVIAPGGLYGSLAPALLTDGLAAALENAGAPLAFVCNLVNKQSQTPDFAVSDYVSEIERFLRPGSVDLVFFNTDNPDEALLKKYALEGEFPVKVDKKVLAEAGYQAIGGKFLSHAPVRRTPGDKFIRRSLIRHDAVAVTAALSKLL